MVSNASTSVADRRVCRRVPLVCNVWQRGLCSGSASRLASTQKSHGLAGRTLNLSDSGALIQLTHLPADAHVRPQVGQHIELTVAVPRTTADTYLLEHVQLDGEVIRVLSHGDDQPTTGFALRFDHAMPLQLD